MFTFDISGQTTPIAVFSDIPNILEVVQEGFSGTPASAVIYMNSASGAGSVTFNGIRYVGVSSVAEGRKFHISSDPVSTAYSLVSALRNTPEVNGSYQVYMDDMTTAVIRIVARQAGYAWNIVMSTDMSGVMLETHASDVYGLDTINVDVYGNGEYLSSLQKASTEKVAFDVSPVIASASDYGKIGQCSMNVFGVTYGGEVASMGSVSFDVIRGYRVNSSPLCIPAESRLAGWLGEGNMKPGADNRTTLYCCPGKTIDFSWINYGETSLEFGISYLSSAKEQVASDSMTVSGVSSPSMVDVSVDMSDYMGNDIFYADITMPDGNVIRWNMIRPEKASDDVARLYWRNGMGGISFFDFTGSISEKRNVSQLEIRKNVYDAYVTDIQGNRLAWGSGTQKSVTMESHLFEEDGKWLFDDLSLARLVWLEWRGMKMLANLSEVEVDETDVNNVYKAKVTVAV